MSVADKLTQLNTIKTDIKNAIIAKGQDVSNNMTTYAAAISNISSGIIPAGTLIISSNGLYDISTYAHADINVPTDPEPTYTSFYIEYIDNDGWVVPSGSTKQYIMPTTNDIYNNWTKLSTEFYKYMNNSEYTKNGYYVSYLAEGPIPVVINDSSLEKLYIKAANTKSTNVHLVYNNAAATRPIELRIINGSGLKEIHSELPITFSCPNNNPDLDGTYIQVGNNNSVLEYLPLMDLRWYNNQSLHYSPFNLNYTAVYENHGGFNNCWHLKWIEGIIYNGDIDLSWYTNLTINSIESIIKNLLQLPSGTTRTLTIKHHYQDAIQQDYLDLATLKGWNIAYK